MLCAICRTTTSVFRMTNRKTMVWKVNKFNKHAERDKINWVFVQRGFFFNAKHFEIGGLEERYPPETYPLPSPSAFSSCITLAVNTFPEDIKNMKYKQNSSKFLQGWLNATKSWNICRYCGKKFKMMAIVMLLFDWCTFSQGRKDLSLLWWRIRGEVLLGTF